MPPDEPRDSLKLLYEISRHFVASLDLKTVLSRVLSLSVENMGAERGMLIVLDDEQKPTEAAIVYQGTLLPYSQPEVETIIYQGLAGWVLRNREPVLLADTSQDQRWLHRPDDDLERSGPKSAICIPIFTTGEHTAGVLTIVHPVPGFFRENHVALLQAIADQAGIAIHNARLYQSLEAAHQRYRELFNASIDPILITDWQGKIREANRTALQVLGVELKIVRQQSVLDLHKPNWEALGIKFENLRGGSLFISYESDLSCQEAGRFIPVHVYVNKVVFQGEQTLQWIMRDISERKALDALQDELMAMIYHDLRSPLSNVISSLDLIKSMLPQGEEELVYIVEIAVRSTERVTRLANSLLDIHRLEAGEPITNLKKVSMQRLVEEALEVISPGAKSKKHTITLRFADGLPSIFVDEDMVRRVLINLLDNAVKFTPAQGEIEMGGTVAEGEMQLWVQDNGIGIPVEAHKRIFDKFTRIKTDQMTRGIGLGLAFCRMAVQAHGGHIRVENVEPHGSRFLFTLPIQKKLQT